MKIKKILWSIILGVYLGADILSHLGYVNRNVAEAATSWNSTNPLVAILIDNNTYNSISWNSNFKRYTDEYIPEKYPGSNAVIFSLNTNEYNAPEIVKLLENVYFDWLKWSASRLIWTIVMWDIPLPVVKYKNYIFPSIYPYTDFIDQKYIWDESEWYFIQNKSNGESEIWHWIISLDDAGKYNDFFEKLKKYNNNPKKFVEKKIWYDDFIALGKNFLWETYQLYKNKMIFAEDLIYHRYTNFLVDMLQLNQQDENADLLWELQDTLAAVNVHIPVVETAKENLLKNKTEFTPTLLLENKLSSFLKDYHEAISTTLLKTVDDNIKASDRWTVNDSHYQKIQLKDQLLLWNEDANWIFKSINDKLEQYVDNKVYTEKYDMKLTIPIYYQRWRDKRKRFFFIKRYVPEYKDTYEFYYFWKNASTISDPQDFSIYRGTYRNLNNFVNYSTIINDSINPAKTKYESTDLTKKWIWSSYDLFSTQVEANRWFNILNMETEYQTYNNEKRHARLNEECWRYWFWISIFWCRERVWEPDWTCITWSEEPSQIADCETFIDFGNRVWGGGTPLNLDMKKYQDQIYQFAWEYNYKNAIKPIFDIAWSVKLKSAQPKATSYEAQTEYISPILMADKWGNLIKTDWHTAYTNARYFRLPTSLINDQNFKKNSDSQFTIKKEKRSSTDEELTYIYRIIPSIIKHDATTELQINGHSWYRYDETSETYSYYKSIMKALDASTDDSYSEKVNSSMIEVQNTIYNFWQQVNNTTNYSIWANIWTILSWIKWLDTILSTALNTITEKTNWQKDNWNKFNAIFWNNYGAMVENYAEGFHQHQINLNDPIDIRSKWYIEIISKIDSVARDLENKRPVAKMIFQSYNNIFSAIEKVKNKIEDKINEVQKIIDDKNNENTNLETENSNLWSENMSLRIENASLDPVEDSDQISANNDTIKENDEKIKENNEKINENKKIIQEAKATKSAWESLKTQLPQIESRVENWLNIIEKCTANHSVLGNIIEADHDTIHYWEETDSCEENEWNNWWEWSADDVITNLVKELQTSKTVFQKYFNADPKNPKEKKPWMNLLTQDRPIDSPRYISFQWIWEHTIKLIYPDIFKVEVYKSEWNNIKLKKTDPENSKNEIYKALQKYFESKVDEYNTILRNEYNSAKSMDNQYYKYIRRVDKLATPDKNIRPYKYFTYDEIIKAIWWEEMLYTIAEILYYQSVAINSREYHDNIWKDIDETRQAFDINKKIWYIMTEYLKEDNDKILRWEKIEWKDIKWERKSFAWLVIPSYNTWWYEVWYINSNWADNISAENDDIDTVLKGWIAATRSATATEDISEIWYEDSPSDDEASQDIKKDCWYDPNESLSLFDGSWFQWLACWLKAVAKKPVTVKVYFQTSPTISSITEPLEQSWDDYKKSFSTTIEWFEDTPQSSENLSQRTQAILTNTQITWNDIKVNVSWRTWSLNFLSFEDLWNIIVKIQSTWDNCLIINWTNTCSWPAVINNNPYKKWFSVNYTLGKTTIWNVMTNISLCSTADNCWVRNMALSVVPWPVKSFSIETATENKVLAWAYTLLKIKALDSKQNEILRTLEKYYVKVNKWTLYINGTSNTTQEVNDFQNLTMLYRAEKWSKGTVTITVEDSKWNVMWKNTINIFPWEIKLNDKDQEDIKYQVSNEKYYNADWSINTKKAIPLKITLKQWWQIVRITSNASFGSKNKLAKIMVAEETRDAQNNKKIKLRETNSLMIENWEKTVYVVPWYKAWEDEITVTVPWLDDKKVKLKIEPGEMKKIGINLENDTIYPKDTIKWEVELTDEWWNKVEKSATVIAKTTTENKVQPSENPTISKGSRKFTIPTTEEDAWLHKITVSSSDWKIIGSKRFTVKNFFLNWAIESWLNIMYLNIFWNDRWNQWWYYSDNKKFAENIIQKSSKTLAVTTQLISPSKIRESAIIFGKKWNIQNLWGLNITATLWNSQLKINVGDVWDFTVTDNINKITAIKSDVSNERLENSIKNDTSNVIYLFDINDDYTYEWWIFKTKWWEKYADVRNWVTFELSKYKLWLNPIWDVTYKWQILASAIIANIDYSKINWKIEGIWYELWEIFDRWTTSSKVKALQSTINTLENSYQWYDSIQNSDELNKYIWFRADFKNITLFAEWESVWESTIPFGSEFLINIWDPLLKNRDEVASKRWLWQVKYSEPSKSIFKVTDIDYNWDGLRDLLVAYRDWSINLLKQYNNSKYEDLWTLMLTAEQINEIFVWDVDWNTFEDIIIKNWKNQIRAYTNSDWVFDVDWNIVCLNTNSKSWETSSNPEDLSWVIQLFIEDMDNDWRSDLVTLDKKWYLKIVYWNGTKSTHSYLSKDVYDCDKNRYQRQEWSTKIVKKFWIKLDTAWIADDSILRWDWLNYPWNNELNNEVINWKLDPNKQQTDLEKQWIYIDPAYLEKLKSWNIDKSEIEKIIALSSDINTTEQAQKASEAASVYVKNPFVWKYLDKLNDENIAFISAYNVEKYNGLTNTKKINKPSKTFRDKNWWDLEDWDEVEVTVTITTNWVHLSEYFDKISWPWIIDRNPATWAPKDLKFTIWTWEIIQWTAWYDFGIINWKWSSWIVGWGALQFKYTLKYRLENPVYRVKIVREKPQTAITVKNAEEEDITIINWNGLKYEEKNKDILIKNPFGTRFKINDWLNNAEQAYINLNDIWEYIDRTSSKEVYPMEKNYKDLNWWSLDNWDTVEVTVRIPLPKSHVHLNAILEDIKWPWRESWTPSNFSITKWSWKLKSWIKWYDFNITEIEPKKEGEEYVFEYKYNLTYKDLNWNPTTDNLPSIIVQPVDWCIKKEEVLENAKINKNRAYNSKIVDLQELANKYAQWAQAKNDEANNKVNKDIANAEKNWTEWSTILKSVNEKFTVNDILKDARWKILSNNWINLWTIDVDITNIMWVDLKKIETNLQKFANSLCHGFTFWTEWWSQTCEWLPVPFNQAFLAPWDYHIMWCIPLPPLTRTIWRWLPMFHFPWTLITPFWPIPIPWWLKSGADDFLRAPWGTYPSMIRIYAAPTLTAQLWIAICVWPQKAWLNLPSPIADIWGNCIVTAVGLPCPSWGWGLSDDDDWNWDNGETYEDWVWEYWDTNLCTPQEKESPFKMVATNTLNSNSYPTSPAEWPYLWGLVNINYDPITSYADNFGDGDTGIEINWVKIQWAKDIKNKLLWGLQQWIQKMLVDWIDRQVQYRINNLLRFEIEFTFPDLSYISTEINKIWWRNIENQTNESKKNNEEEMEQAKNAAKWNKQAQEIIEKTMKTVKDLTISKEQIKQLNLAEGANPFKDLQELFNNTELVNIRTQRIQIKVPWIYSEDIEAYKNYLLTWYEDNSTTLNWWIATAESAVANCKKADKTNPEKAKHCQLVESAQSKLLRLSNKFEKIWPQIFQNVQTLEAYKRFPLQIYEWLHVTDKYLWDISALIWNFFWYINYWMEVNANRFTQYCDAIITIVTIVKTYQIMIDLFADWWAKCWKCTQDTYDQYSCKLSFLCSAFEIPTIAIPSVKIPSLYIDLSNFNLQMDILLPRFTFKPEWIELPRLPNLPQPPDLGIDFNIDFDIPDIPQLPQPPELPELPSFIPQVKMELPILPPAPTIPEIPNQITWLLNVAKTLSKIFCIIKSWIWLVWESAVKARIEQMTQRSYEVPRVDNLDLTFFFKQAPLQGIDIEVDSYVNLQYNFDAFYSLLKSIVDPINQKTYSLLKQAENWVDYLNSETSQFSQDLDNVTNRSVILKAEITKANSPEKMKEQLYELRDSLLNIKDKERVDEVLAFASTNTKVEKNEKGINKIKNDLDKLISQEKDSVNQLAELAMNDYDWFLNSIKDRKSDGPYQLTLSTNLLNKNENAENVISKFNATEMLIETENKKVDWYYSALKNHTASELNMSDETYQNSMKYMASIKDKINQRYSIKKNQYEWTTILQDNNWEIVEKPLLAATNTTPSLNEASTNDYSQYVKWIYIKDWDKTISAVNSEYNYNKFIWYYEKDLDKDWKNELIMWDNNNVFVKYFEKWNTKGRSAIVIKPTLKEGSQKQYIAAGWLFSNQIKVYDENAEIKNFELHWQNYDAISVSFDNDKFASTSWYLLRMTERVDWFREKNSEKDTKYILFLPRGSEEEVENLWIELQWRTQYIKKLIWDKIYEVRYYNPSDETLRFSLPEVPRKWQYIQVTTVKLNWKFYQQNAPWSNQLVWWRQAVGDGEPPKATVELERVKKGNEVIDNWFDLEWYVGTYYNLRITRFDETKVRETKLIERDSENNTGKVLNERDFDAFTGIILIPDLFFKKKETKIYKINAVDSQGNDIEETINLNIEIPWISIEDIVRNDWYKEWIKGPVSIISELETDIDKWDVSFERFRNNQTTPITATEWWTENQTYPVTTNQTRVTGQYYDYWDNIWLYTKDNKQFANVNWENGEIEIKGEYAQNIKPRVDLSQWYPTVKLMDWDTPLFEIIIEPEELIKTEVYKWKIIELEWWNYWAFEWGIAILNNDKVILYIGPTWVLYTTENLQWDYVFNKADETITYKIYEAFGDDIASITFKAKPLE